MGTLNAKTAAEVEQDAFNAARQAATQRIETGYNAAFKALTASYPRIEREGWGEQVAGARDHQAGVPSVVVDGLAAARGISSDDMAQRIFNKQEDYQQQYAAATGILGALRDSVDAATTVSDLEAIVWPTT